MIAPGPRAALAFLNTHARWALPIGVSIGIALPPLAEALHPLLTPAVIGTLAAVLLRLDPVSLVRALGRPGLAARIVVWQLLAAPLLMLLIAGGAQRIGALAPGLLLLAVLQAAAPPIGSAALFAMILGFDGVLCMVVTVISTLLLPLSLTALVAWGLPEAGLSVDPWRFFARVSLLVLLPFALAAVLRAVIGAARLRAADAAIGGANIVLLVVFAIGVMHGVGARLLADPSHVLRLLALAVVSTAALHAAGYLLFAHRGPTIGFGAALVSGNRNMGLMLAVTAGSAGEAFSMYVGIAQIPMYFAPMLLTPFVRHARARDPW